MRQSGMYGVAHLPALSPLGRATNHTVNAAVSKHLTLCRRLHCPPPQRIRRPPWGRYLRDTSGHHEIIHFSLTFSTSTAPYRTYRLLITMAVAADNAGSNSLTAYLAQASLPPLVLKDTLPPVQHLSSLWPRMHELFYDEPHTRVVRKVTIIPLLELQNALRTCTSCLVLSCLKYCFAVPNHHMGVWACHSQPNFPEQTSTGSRTPRSSGRTRRSRCPPWARSPSVTGRSAG